MIDNDKDKNGYPVIIRLIDPPLHEFLPGGEELTKKIVTKRIEEVITVCSRQRRNQGTCRPRRSLLSSRSHARKQPDDGFARCSPEHRNARDR